MEFSLVRGGPSYRLGSAIRAATGRMTSGVGAGLALALVSWLPLVALALAQGVAYGEVVRIPLLNDLVVYARYLVAIPLLVSTAAKLDRRLVMAMHSFVACGLVKEARRDDLQRAIRGMERWRDAWLPELVMLAAALAHGWFGLDDEWAAGVTSWTALGAPPQPTWAGYWHAIVGLPVFDFLVLRWGWRLFLWTRLLWGISRLDLDVVPSHPDRAGGLGFVGVAQGGFNMLASALAVVFSARAAQLIVHAGESPDRFQAPIIAFVVLCLLLFQGPLLLFIPPLIAAKVRGRAEFDRLANEYSRGFERKWVRAARPDAQALGSPDIQSLADLGTAWSVVETMRVVPIQPRQAISLAVSALLPMLPMLATAVPLKTILTKLMQVLGR